MGAKFILDRRCVVKSTLTLTGLIEALKHRGLLRKVGELAASGALPPHDANTRLEMLLPPEAGLPSHLTIGELQAQAQTLSDYRITCRQCPSSLTGHVGGCIVYVPYPLSEGMQYLLWRTAVKGMEGALPEAVQGRVRTFADRAQQLSSTPFADGMKARGDLLGSRSRVHRSGPPWQRRRLSSAQVLDAFFVSGMLSAEELWVHEGFLAAALALARGLEQTIEDEERRQAMVEDTEAYLQVLRLMQLALDQGLGVYVWP